MVVSFCAVTAHAQTTNLALNRPVFASSAYPTLAPSLAVDGNGSTRWSSNFSDNEWWYVDLGATYALSKVVINWESAYAKTYDLQVSQDAVTWTTLFSGTNTFPVNGAGTSTVTTPGTGRYVRVLGKTRAVVWGGQWGYSFYEFQAFGTLVSPPPAVTGLSPVDQAPLAPLTQQLAWTAAPGATSYDVAFGITNPPPVVSTGQAAVTYSPGPLTYGTTYYWRVTSKNASGSTAGSLARFTTLGQPVVTTITVTPLSATAAVGATRNFAAAATDQYGNPIAVPIVWTSSSPGVASIAPATGVATALAAGTVTITAASGAKSGAASFTITAPPVLTSVVVSPAAPSLPAASNQPFSAQGRDQYGAPFAATFAWTSSAPSIGTINAATGAFAAVAAGTTTVTATSGSISGSAMVTVTAAPVLTTITVTPQAPSVAAAAKLTLTAKGFDQQSQPFATGFSWTSSAPAIGTVDAAGVFTAIAPGTTTVTATSGTVSGSTTITVTGAVLTSLAVSPASPQLSEGATQAMTAQGFDQFNQPFVATVTWTSSATSVGAINPSTGLFTAVAAGTTTVTATSGSVTGATTVTVTPAPPVLTSISVTPQTSTVLAGGTIDFSAQGLDQNSAPFSTTFTWTSSAPSVGTIDAAIGVFAAVAPGTTTITATSGTVTRTATVNVTPSHNTNLNRLRVVSWNVGQGYTESRQFVHQAQIDLIASMSPDIVVLSEISLADNDMVSELPGGDDFENREGVGGPFQPGNPGGRPRQFDRRHDHDMAARR